MDFRLNSDTLSAIFFAFVHDNLTLRFVASYNNPRNSICFAGTKELLSMLTSQPLDRRVLTTRSVQRRLTSWDGAMIRKSSHATYEQGFTKFKGFLRDNDIKSISM